AEDHIFSKCSGQKTPEGVIAAVRIPKYSFISIAADKKPLVILDGINDPGNLGTILRTADAFGMGGVLMLPGCADAYSPKTVQSTMGSILRVKCMNAGEAELNALKAAGYTVYGMTLEGKPMEQEDFSDSPIALVIGSESHGMGNFASGMCDKFLSIRMPGKAESLNAAIAAGIAMHHITWR
ncbi:MAG: RNA methyltransferase, partial [Clostridia bacterium]|nr:RNA methyltransferase [Clostridia bacterium]